MADNIYQKIPEQLPEELCETLVKHKSVHIERIISCGHITPEGQWYDQEKNEWVLILKGAARIKFVDDTIVDLSEGSYVNIPAHKKHRVEWVEENIKTVWLAIYY